MLQLTTPQSSQILESLPGIPLTSIISKTIPASMANASSTTPDLFATFSKTTIEELLAVDNCQGIRIYPAIKENELLLIAGCVDSNNRDLIGTNATCGCGYSNPAVDSHTEDLVESKKMIRADDHPETPIKQHLRTLQNVNGSNLIFKAYFDRAFFKDHFTTSDKVRFDISEINFNGNGKTFRTVSAMFLNAPSLQIHASLLPCPPYCGGGSGGEYISS